MTKHDAMNEAYAHMHEIIALKAAYDVAKARRHDEFNHSDVAVDLKDTIDREMADLAIVIDNWIVRPEIRATREQKFGMYGVTMNAELIKKTLTTTH